MHLVDKCKLNLENRGVSGALLTDLKTVWLSLIQASYFEITGIQFWQHLMSVSGKLFYKPPAKG